MGSQLPSGHNPPSPNTHSLFALMGIGLWHRLRQPHLKLVAPQRHLLVVGDEVVEAVEHQVVRQEELGAAGILPRVDPAVLHLPVAPVEEGGGKTRVVCGDFVSASGTAPAWTRHSCPTGDPSCRGPKGLGPSGTET